MFIFEAIAGGIIFDALKEGLDITKKFIKKKLNNVIIDSLTEEELTTLVNEINGLSNEQKEDIQKFKEAVNSNLKLIELISNIKDIQISSDSKINVSNSILNQSPVINNPKGEVKIDYGKK